MKRYLLFAGDIYYPQGGMNDFIGDFKDVIPARAASVKKCSGVECDWWHIYDTKTMKIIEESGRDDDE